MSKLKFNYDGKDYCLEFTKQSVKTMEQRGFVASRILEAPMTLLPDLFAGAFLANHKFTDRKVIDAIFEKMDNKPEMIDILSKMYNEPIEGLLTSDGDEGNAIAWTTT